MTRSRTTTTAVALCAAAVVVCASGCADAPVAGPVGDAPAVVAGRTTGPASTPVLSARPGPADVGFLRMMQPHHDQGLLLADLAPSRTGTPAVRDLALRIGRAHAEEVGQLEGLLRSWGLPPRTSAPRDVAMEASMGMAGDVEVADLARRRGADFDRRWLALMVRHHEGAVAAAREMVGRPSSASVRTLAENVVAVQDAQIERMRQLGAVG